MSEDVLFILEILLFKNITVFFFTVLFSVLGGHGSTSEVSPWSLGHQQMAGPEPRAQHKINLKNTSV